MIAPVDRVLSKCVEDPATGCWLFTGYKTNGYGRIQIASRPSRQRVAHAVVYEALIADVPEGLQLDHLCRNKACVNPWHLEPVTQSVNLLRIPAGVLGSGLRERTHCKNGHELTPDNVATYEKYRGRFCRTCHRERQRARWVRAVDLPLEGESA